MKACEACIGLSKDCGVPSYTPSRAPLAATAGEQFFSPLLRSDCSGVISFASAVALILVIYLHATVWRLNCPWRSTGNCSTAYIQRGGDSLCLKSRHMHANQQPLHGELAAPHLSQVIPLVHVTPSRCLSSMKRLGEESVGMTGM